jgi:hypothetical protein
MSINQAVVFTKPLHHIDIDLTPEQLNHRAHEFLAASGFEIVYCKKVTGPELADREIIRQHYLMYSKASYGDFSITDEGRKKFQAAFGKEWDAEVRARRIMGNPQLLEAKAIDVDELFRRWNAAPVQKVQAGLLMAPLDGLDCYCINAFYPAMESNFYNPKTCINYYVVEFDPAQVSWQRFRKQVLGATNAAKADPESFRGQLYAKYKVEFPGRDNFVHGSAGPLEGLVERSIHEFDFDMATNPVGKYLLNLGVTLERFKEWKARKSIAELGAFFDATEEKNTDEIFAVVVSIIFRTFVLRSSVS